MQRGRRQRSRNTGQLAQRTSVEAPTLKREEESLDLLEQWLLRHNVSVEVPALMAAPLLLDLLLRNFGIYLFETRLPYYRFIYVLTACQRRQPSLRGQLSLSWDLATLWEELEPVVHRTPIPLPLFKALVSTALAWQWNRFAAVVLISFCGISRSGEPHRATRGDLVLPCDRLEPDLGRVLMRVQAPKTRRRGGGRVQHLTIEGHLEVSFIEAVLAELPPEARLFHLSGAAFRRRWDSLLNALQIPPGTYTPAGLRGGGAIAHYQQGMPISELQWRMRLQGQDSLRHYLQEVTCEISLASLHLGARRRILSAAQFYEHWLHFSCSPSSASLTSMWQRDAPQQPHATHPRA